MSPSHGALGHFEAARTLWETAQRIEENRNILITGKQLDIATVYAASRGNCLPLLTDDQRTRAGIHDSVEQLGLYLDRGHAVYGEAAAPLSSELRRY